MQICLLHLEYFWIGIYAGNGGIWLRASRSMIVLASLNDKAGLSGQFLFLFHMFVNHASLNKSPRLGFICIEPHLSIHCIC